MEGFVAYAPPRRRSPGWSASHAGRARAGDEGARGSRTACRSIRVTWGEIVGAGGKVGLAAGDIEALARRCRYPRGSRSVGSLRCPVVRSRPARPPTCMASRAAALLPLALAPASRPRRTPPCRSTSCALPAGFRIELVTDAVPNARQMALGRSADGKSVVYVGSAQRGQGLRRPDTRRGRAGPCAPSPPACRCRRASPTATAPLRRRGLADPALRRHRRQARRSRRRRWSSPTAFRRRRTTAGSSSPSVPTASSTCRSARRATSASRASATASSSA